MEKGKIVFELVQKRAKKGRKKVDEVKNSC